MQIGSGLVVVNDCGGCCGHGWFKGTGMVALGEGQLERGKGGVGGGGSKEEG
jgi:hypothetical protein